MVNKGTSIRGLLSGLLATLVLPLLGLATWSQYREVQLDLRRVEGELEGFACQLVAAEALRWLEQERDPTRPFFLFVCFHEPHEPVASPDDLVASYPDARTPDEAQYLANVTNLDRALGELIIDGIDTTVPLFHALIQEPEILAGDYDIHWLEGWLKDNLG